MLVVTKMFLLETSKKAYRSYVQSIYRTLSLVAPFHFEIRDPVKQIEARITKTKDVISSLLAYIEDLK